jgi:hypothetical protein
MMRVQIASALIVAGSVFLVLGICVAGAIALAGLAIATSWIATEYGIIGLLAAFLALGGALICVGRAALVSDDQGAGQK